MIRTTIRMGAALGVVAALAACGNRGNDDEVVIVEPAPTPIFAKDGTVINDPQVGQ